MRVGRNVILNLVGFVVPAAVLFLAYPPFLRALGADRFGILTLAMSLAAALSFLDFGLSAASIRFVASDLHRGESDGAGKVATTALAFFAGLGLVISFVLFVLSPWVADWLKVPASVKDEAVAIFRITALQISFSLFVGTLSGLLKAFDRFDLATLLVSLLAILTYGLPAFQVSVLGHSLTAAVAAGVLSLAMLSALGLLLLSRSAAEHGVHLKRCLPDRGSFRRVFSFGVVLTLHALVGMLFTHGQRVLVAFLFGPAALTAYQLALTLVSKVHAGINAAAEVVLPVASRGESDLLSKIYKKGQIVTLLMAAVPLLGIAVFADPLMAAWMGKGSAPQAVELLPLLCGAYFFVSLSAMPYHILNGLGFPLANTVFAVINVLLFAVGLAIQYVFYGLLLWHVALWYLVSNMLIGIVYQMYCASKISSSLSGAAASRLQSAHEAA